MAGERALLLESGKKSPVMAQEKYGIRIRIFTISQNFGISMGQQSGY